MTRGRPGAGRAYSLNLLNAHAVVNDRFGDRPVAVIGCPVKAQMRPAGLWRERQ